MKHSVFVLVGLFASCSKVEPAKPKQSHTIDSSVAVSKPVVVAVDSLPEEGALLFRSKHRFRIKYPSTWILDARYLEEVDTISWQSGFTLYNYRMDTLSHPGHFETPGIMKIEVHFMKPQQDQNDRIIREEMILIDGVSCRKLLLKTEFGPLLCVNFFKKSQYVNFYGYAADSSNYGQFRKIVESFRLD